MDFVIRGTCFSVPKGRGFTEDGDIWGRLPDNPKADTGGGGGGGMEIREEEKEEERQEAY